MSSTIRDWKTMWTVKWTADSTWGRSNVGPNTMETLGTDILLNSPCSITLREEESRGGGGGVTHPEIPKVERWVSLKKKGQFPSRVL